MKKIKTNTAAETLNITAVEDLDFLFDTILSKLSEYGNVLSAYLIDEDDKLIVVAEINFGIDDQWCMSAYVGEHGEIIDALMDCETFDTIYKTHTAEMWF